MLPKRCNWKAFQYNDFKSTSICRIELKDETIMKSQINKVDVKYMK